MVAVGEGQRFRGLGNPATWFRWMKERKYEVTTHPQDSHVGLHLQLKTCRDKRIEMLQDSRIYSFVFVQPVSACTDVGSR